MKRLLLPNFSLRKKSLIKRNNWNRNNWNRKVWLPFIITTITWLYLSGCQAGILSKFFEEQQWSENYALLEGVTCTTPEMIDGDMNTVGISGRHEVIITLPERKSIHRILIRGGQLETGR